MEITPYSLSKSAAEKQTSVELTATHQDWDWDSVPKGLQPAIWHMRQEWCVPGCNFAGFYRQEMITANGWQGSIALWSLTLSFLLLLPVFWVTAITFVKIFAIIVVGLYEKVIFFLTFLKKNCFVFFYCNVDLKVDECM